MTTLLLENLKQKIDTLELEPASGGCFEVSVDGDTIYSKLETGEFPDELAILSAVEQRVSA